jgi:hypothetical protein
LGEIIIIMVVVKRKDESGRIWENSGDSRESDVKMAALEKGEKLLWRIHLHECPI